MLRSLRPTPAHAPRPLPTDEAVLARAVSGRLAQVRAWMDDTAQSVKVNDDQLVNCLTTAMARADGEPFASAVWLHQGAGFAPDYALTKILADIAADLPGALRATTRDWVMAHGLRLPCKDGDEIEWLSPQGEPRAGKVKACDNSLAAVAVEVGSTLGQASGVHIRVLMEQIYCNRTQMRFEPEHPPLGLRFVDAPALAAACPARTGDYLPSSTSPGVDLNHWKAPASAETDAPGGPGRAA